MGISRASVCNPSQEGAASILSNNIIHKDPEKAAQSLLAFYIIGGRTKEWIRTSNFESSQVLRSTKYSFKLEYQISHLPFRCYINLAAKNTPPHLIGLASHTFLSLSGYKSGLQSGSTACSFQDQGMKGQPLSGIHHYQGKKRKRQNPKMKSVNASCKWLLPTSPSLAHHGSKQGTGANLTLGGSGPGLGGTCKPHGMVASILLLQVVEQTVGDSTIFHRCPSVSLSTHHIFRNWWTCLFPGQIFFPFLQSY